MCPASAPRKLLDELCTGNRRSCSQPDKARRSKVRDIGDRRFHKIIHRCHQRQPPQQLLSLFAGFGQAGRKGVVRGEHTGKVFVQHAENGPRQARYIHNVGWIIFIDRIGDAIGRDNSSFSICVLHINGQARQ
jgi:hypothetical protein